jgi:hypothetical protein
MALAFCGKPFLQAGVFPPAPGTYDLSRFSQSLRCLSVSSKKALAPLPLKNHELQIKRLSTK